MTMTAYKRFQRLAETARACREENLAAQRRFAFAEHGTIAAKRAAEDCDYWNDLYHDIWKKALDAVEAPSRKPAS